MTDLTRSLGSALLGLLLLVGCGGAGGGGTSLTVEIVGLPAGLASDVRVSGDGVSRTVTSTQTLSLPPGSYRIDARAVERTERPIVAGETYAATLTSTQVTLIGRATVRASYRATSDVVLLVPSFTVDTERDSLRLLGVQDLAVGLHAGTGALGDERSITGAAIGPSGRVYLTAWRDDLVRVVTVSTVTAGVSVTKVASFSGTGTSTEAPLALTFDRGGNLWLLSGGGTPTLHRFASDDVQGVTTVGALLTPQVSVTLPPNGAGAPVDDRADIVTLLVDGSDRLWVVDERGNRVVRYGGASTLGAAASPTMVRDAGLQGPTSLVVDSSGRAYLATAVGVLRYADATAFTSPATMPLTIASDDRPETLALDASGALWVGTQAGRLLRVVDPQGIANVDRDLAWTLASEARAPTFGGNAIFVPPLDR